MSRDSESTLTTGEVRESSLVEWVVVYLKGLAMGSADAIPGISGGTIALIVGIYERLVRAITSLDPRVLAHLPTLHTKEGRTGLWSAIDSMDIPFLLALGLGMGTAIVLLARVMEAALEAVPAVTFAFFVGLIGASAVVLFDRRWMKQPGPVLAAVTGFVVAFLVAGASAEGTLPHTLPVVFGAGMLAVSGMILPGISGAFILLLLGQYEFMTETLNRFVDATLSVLTGGSLAEFVDAGTVVVTFVTGAFAGLVTVAYVVRSALDRYRYATLAFLVSLMVGALRYPVEQVLGETNGPSVTVVAGLVVAGIVGAGLVLVLDRYTEDLDYDAT